MEQFFDPFIYSVATVVAALVFLDFLIGEQRRQHLRDGLETFWIYIEDKSFSGLAKEDAQKLLDWLTKKFGDNWKSYGFMFRSWIYIVVIFLFSQSIVSLPYDTNSVEFVTLLMTFIIAVIPNMFTGWLSLAISIRLLTVMANRKPSFVLLLVVLTIDLLAATLLSLVALASLEFTPTIVSQFFPEQFYYYRELAFGPTVLTNALPTALHCILTVVFLGSKLLRPLIKTPLSALIFAFTESKKGPLTLISIGLGTIANLTHQWLIYFN